MTIDPTVKKVMQILLQDGTDAAQKFIATDLANSVQQAKLKLEEAQRAEESAKKLLMLAQAGNEPESGSSANQTPLPEVVKPAQATDKRAVIASAADVVAPKVGDRVTTTAVLKQIESSGHALEGARPGTAIGNVLYRDGKWKRIGEGEFERTE